MRPFDVALNVGLVSLSCAVKIEYSENFVELKNNFEIILIFVKFIWLLHLNSFVDTNIFELSQKTANMLNKNTTDLEIGIIYFQSDLQLKTGISYADILIFAVETKYPLLRRNFSKVKLLLWL